MSTETDTPELLAVLFTDWANRSGILGHIEDRQQVADLALAFGAGYMIAQECTRTGRDAVRAAMADVVPHLWLCGCLINDAGAHRVGCPEHPEGIRG